MNTVTASLSVPAPSGRLTARLASVNELSPATVSQMWGLFARHYEGVSRARFDRDLGEKTRVILATDSGDGALRGFSTIQVLGRRIGGRRATVVYSGDTIIDPAYWGQRALQGAFLRLLVLTKLSAPATPLYWFLISKGYKTYLLLARNFHRFWPRQGQATPAPQAELIRSLAAEKFGRAYRDDLGIIQAEDGRVRAGLAPITAELLRDPDVRFFVERNPGHAAGDELCCLGRFDLATCWGALRKQLRGRR